MDQREAIIARLEAIANESALFHLDGVFRNVIEFPDVETIPACAILEGDEEADEGDPVLRGSSAPRIVHMLPEVVIYAGERPEDVGAKLNLLRSGLIGAILTDAELISLTMNARGARYIGMKSDIAFGREMVGRMALQFSIPCVLIPVNPTTV